MQKLTRTRLLLPIFVTIILISALYYAKFHLAPEWRISFPLTFQYFPIFFGVLYIVWLFSSLRKWTVKTFLLTVGFLISLHISFVLLNGISFFIAAYIDSLMNAENEISREGTSVFLQTLAYGLYGGWLLLGLWQFVLVKFFRRYIQISYKTVAIPFLIITCLFLLESFYLSPKVYEPIYQKRIESINKQFSVVNPPRAIPCYKGYDFGIQLDINVLQDMEAVLEVDSPHFHGGRLDQKYSYIINVNEQTITEGDVPEFQANGLSNTITLKKGTHQIELLAVVRPEYNLEEYLNKFGNQRLTDEMLLGEPDEKRGIGIKIRADELTYGDDVLYSESVKWPDEEVVSDCE